MPNRAFGRGGLILAAAFGVAAVWIGFSERAALVNDRAVEAANAGDWRTADLAAREALAQDPAMPPYSFTLGLAEAHIGQPEAALAHIQKSAEIDDYPVAWLDVARLELDLGNQAAGRAALEKAMRLGYQQPQVAFGASQMYAELGDRPPAVAALARALLVAPTLASDPWWDTTDQRRLLEDALDTAIPAATPDVAYRLALEGNRPDAATAIVAAMPADLKVTADLVVRAWAGDAAAFETLHARAIDDPLDVDAVLQCLRVADRTIEMAAGRWRCDGAGVPAIPVIVRVVPMRRFLMPLPGVADPTPYFLNYYRRNGPFDQLAPGIPQLSVMPLP